jgi:putative ABC transport system permease protein
MRYAIRRLVHQPGFSLVVILTLALGIGANTAIFSLVNAVLLRALPYDQPERLVTLDHYYPDLNNLEAGFAVPSYKEITERTHVFDAFAVAGRWNVNLTGTGEPEKLTGSYATADFLAASALVLAPWYSTNACSSSRSATTWSCLTKLPGSSRRYHVLDRSW